LSTLSLFHFLFVSPSLSLSLSNVSLSNVSLSVSQERDNLAALDPATVNALGAILTASLAELYSLHL
jgi:hypothetical protein